MTAAATALDEVVKIGTADCTADWWTVFSDTVQVKSGESVTVNFKNYTSGTNNWFNFLVVLQNMADAHTNDATKAETLTYDANYAEYAVVRADNYGWGKGYDNIVTPECNWNWTTAPDMNGADVVLTVTNNDGATADVTAVITTPSGTVINQNYKGIVITGDLYFCLTCEEAYLEIQQ